MNTRGQSSEAAPVTIDDLSLAILTWLDERPPGFVRRSASPNWSSRELRDAFRANLDQALRTAIAAAKWAEVIAYLVDAFTTAPSGSLVRPSQWGVALREGDAPETFDLMRSDIAELLEESREGPAPGLSPGKFATLIVRALNGALQEEAARISPDGISPEAVLQYYMIPDHVQRKYNVRTFLFFFGLIIATLIVYAIIAPNSWFNPGTALFAALGYVTLIITAVYHEHSNERFR